MGFFNSFFGIDQRKDLKRANAQAESALSQGYGDQTGYYNQAIGTLSPYQKQGTAANDMYYNALGTNGADAQNTAINTITSNPLFQGQLEQDSNAVARRLNAVGQGGGGLANLAAQRVFQQTAGNWLDRYRDAGNQGFQASGAVAGLQQGLGDNAMGYGATKAGNAINYGNALASSRNIGINNLLNTIGAVSNAAKTAMTGM